MYQYHIIIVFKHTISSIWPKHKFIGINKYINTLNVRKADKSWCIYINFVFNMQVIGVGTGIKNTL